MKYDPVTRKDKLILALHPGQSQAWDSLKRFVFIFSGAQSGKTEFAVHWLKREIDKCGPGDYIAATSTFPLMDKKMLPAFMYVFKELYHLGDYNGKKAMFTYSDGKTRVIFASAVNPDAIESATAKAAWLDEFAQNQWKYATWDAIIRRLSISQGRVLGTSTLYGPSWCKKEIYDPGLKSAKDIDIIQVDSIVNPSFPREEWDRVKARMPPWKFDLFYRGVFSKPAGLIYDCFNTETAVIPRFKIPPEWGRYVGMDFGTSNTAVLWYALEPTSGNLYLYREYLEGGKAAAEHAVQLKVYSAGEPIRKSCGGAATEDGWRESFNVAGWHVQKPLIRDVQVGIDKVYAFHKLNKLFIFENMYGYLEEKQLYSRELDENNEPTDKIHDKESQHYMDAERYILSELSAAPVANDTVRVTRYYA